MTTMGSGIGPMETSIGSLTMQDTCADVICQQTTSPFFEKTVAICENNSPTLGELNGVKKSKLFRNLMKTQHETLGTSEPSRHQTR
mmetsp:Transcript_4957/g.9987  ORF Transcript_4957/g.9987 Transcript_4957/m.9987 type:complete len:86 (+) Transcript_4957:650-907(+)